MKNSLQNIVEVFRKITIYKTNIFLGIFIALLIARVWLITGIPLVLIDGPHDDFFFVKAAHHIIQGDWMGPYSQMTLIKGPFYAFFLIFSYITGLPLFLNETIFYILACLVLFYAVRPLVRNCWWRLLLFTLILFSPSSLAANTNIRVYREFVYFSLTLFVIAFSIGLLLRIDNKIPTLRLWSAGLGGSMGAFMIAREEGIWIYPILFLLLIYCLFFIWRGKMDNKISRSFLVLLPILLWCLPIFGVSYLNYSHYGYWGTTELLDPDFNQVLNTLGRIKVDASYPHVQVTEEALKKAYKVSPLLSSLKKVIKNITPAYLGHSSAGLQEYPDWYIQAYSDDGTEVGRGHFLWLMRDAVYWSGYYTEGKYPHAFYRQLADQLEAACKNGKLDCVPRNTLPIKPRYIPIILRMFYDSSLQVLRMDRVVMMPADLAGKWPPDDIYTRYFVQLIYNPINRPELDPDQITGNSINGQLDLRLETIRNKVKIMDAILKIYKGFTLPAFAAGMIVWLALLFASISKKQFESEMPYLFISIFLLGLCVSRLATLVLTVGGASARYGVSIYLFIYLFIFLLLYWGANSLSRLWLGRESSSLLENGRQP